MPTPDEIAQAEKRLRLSGSVATGVKTLTLPEVPYHPLPAEALKRVPSLHQWNLENHAKLSRWRQESNAAIARLPNAAPATTTP